MIKNDKEHDAVLERIGELWGAPGDTPEGEELDRLIGEVGEYEGIDWQELLKDMQDFHYDFEESTFEGGV